MHVTYNPSFSEKWIMHLSPQEWRGHVRMELREVPLRLVEHAGCHTDPDVVTGWLETLHSGRPIPPPVVVATETGTYYTHDGNHRLIALQEFLGSDATVSVAEAVPLRDFAFRRTMIDDYYTYQLCCTALARRLEKFMVPPAVVLASVILAFTQRDPGALLTLFCIAVVLTAIYWGMAGAAVLTFATLALGAYYTDPVNSLLVGSVTHALQLLLIGAGMLWISYVICRRNWREQ